MAEAMTARLRRLHARREAILKQIEVINGQIRDLEQSTGTRGSRLLRKRPVRRRR
ncbi:hypothetical protein K8I85_04225 [bacterium]|nr:hypothetical protein [bacterium]